MSRIPKKVIERYKKTIPKFKRILQTASDRDLNEADTVVIIQDMLAEVFGFEKYLEITSEYAIRSTYCDLAIKMEDKIQYLLEVKAIGITLKPDHLRQAVNYGANHGVQWVVLTNGLIWELYRLRFERPINYDLVSSFNFLEVNPKKEEDQQKLFLLSKRGLGKSLRQGYYERTQSVNRFVIGAIVLGDSVASAVRRDMRKLAPGIKVEIQEIKEILRNEVLKRDVIEGEEASKAFKRVGKLSRKTTKRPRKPKVEEPEEPQPPQTPFADYER
jgi:hypothetical protein